LALLKIHNFPKIGRMNFLVKWDMMQQFLELLGFLSSVGIHKHFMGAEIPGFGLPNRFFGLTISCFFKDGIVN
jgi:hypothetical protein